MSPNTPKKDSPKDIAQRLRQDISHIKALQSFWVNIEQIQEITRSGAHKIISTSFEPWVNGKILLVGTKPQSSYAWSEIYGKNLIMFTPYISYEKWDYTKPVRKVGISGWIKK